MFENPRPRRGAHRAGRRDPDEEFPGAETGPGGVRRHWPDEPYPRAPWLRRALAGPLARSIAWSALAVALVAGLIAVVWVVSGGSSSPQPGATSTRPAGPTAAPSTTSASSSRTQTSSPQPTSRPAGPTASRSAPPPKPTSTPPPTPPPTPTTVAPADEPPLLVLNNSRITGLAAKAARDFAATGWRIAGVGNFTGRIPVTTVYYAPGQLAAARALIARFPAVERALPRFAGLPGSGLTVVLTRFYPH